MGFSWVNFLALRDRRGVGLLEEEDVVDECWTGVCESDGTVASV